MLPMSRSTAFFGVVALTLFSLALRFAGIDYYLPYGRLGDERVYGEFIQRMASDPSTDPAQFPFYPQLVPRIALLLRTEPQAALTTLEDHLAYAAADLVLVRRVVAALSVLAVPATYRIARRFLGRAASLLAAGLTSTSFLGLWYSTQARPHGAFMALSALSLLAALEVRRHGGLRAWLLAAIACAAAIGTLQTGVFLLGPLAVAYLLPGGRRTGRAHFLLLASLALAALSVRLYYPFLFTDLGIDADASRPLGQHNLFGNLSGNGFAHALRALWDYDPWLTLCSALGILVLCGSWIAGRTPGAPVRPRLREWIATPRGGDLVVLASFVLPLGLVIGLYEYTNPRYMLPFVPLLAVCTAGGFERAGALLAARPPGAPSRAWTYAAIAVFAVQALSASALSGVRTASDTLERAADWIRSNTVRGQDRIVVTPGIELPLLHGESGMPWVRLNQDNPRNLWLAYQNRIDPAVRTSLGSTLLVPNLRTQEDRALIEKDPELYFESVSANYVVLHLPDSQPVYARIREATHRRGTLVARFSPWRFGSGDERPFLMYEWSHRSQLPGDWLWHALRARCLGPVVEIYRLDAQRR